MTQKAFYQLGWIGLIRALRRAAGFTMNVLGVSKFIG